MTQVTACFRRSVPAAAMLDTYFFSLYTADAFFSATHRFVSSMSHSFFLLQHRSTRGCHQEGFSSFNTGEQETKGILLALFLRMRWMKSIFVCSAAHVTYSLQTHLYNRVKWKKNLAFACGHVIFYFL